MDKIPITSKCFIFDLGKCTGCGACVLACSIENEVPLSITWRNIYTYNEFHFPGIGFFHLSLACNHCGDPPCMRNCPAAAYSKDPATGAVILDSERCIGCGYCAWVCPYDAPVFNSETGMMEKCTLCRHRLKQGLEPACVTLCPTTALQWGDRDNDEPSEPIPGFPAYPIQPAIRFRKRKNEVPDQMSLTEEEVEIDTLLTMLPERPSKVSLSREWSLMVFTTLVAVLSGWWGAILLFDFPLRPLLFGMLALSTILFSLGHLGRKRRAVRAIVHIRSSWLSREIFFFIAFLVTAGISLLNSHASPILSWTALLFAFAALFAIDRVYQVAAAQKLQYHSARTIFIAILILSLLSRNDEIIMITLFATLLLYANRKLFQGNSFRSSWSELAVLRIGLGFFAPVILLLTGKESLYYPAVLCVIAGEFLDRWEFYLNLDIRTPQSQIWDDLGREIQHWQEKEGRT